MAKHRFLFVVAALASSSLFACSHDARPSQAPPSPAAASAPSIAASTNAIKTQEVAYEAAGTRMKGFLAYPSQLTGKAPGVLVVHEWWGLNDYARSRARQLAEMGYVAMAVDMYGEGKVATHPDEAKKFVGEVMANMDVGVTRFEAALTALSAFEHTDADKIAAIGYCFGGGVVLHMARVGKDLDVVASFHGSLPTQTPMAKDAFQGRILVATGADDSFVPPEQIKAFEDEMKAANARYEVVSYAGAKHGFTNPEATEAGKATGLPIAYDAQADAASWQKLSELLSETWSAP